MKQVIYLTPSKNKGKKYKVQIDNKTVHFGAKGYSDYTMHKDNERKARYISRHKNNEAWTKKGIKTAGFWSRWLLWNKPTIGGSVKNIQSKFNVTIRRGAKPAKSRSR